MQILYFALIAVLAVLIYRQGIKDGQKVSSGEKIADKPLQLFKGTKKTKIEKGLENIISYGMGGNKG